MKKITGYKKVRLVKKRNGSWKTEKIYRQINYYALELDRRRDASAIRSDKMQSAPLDLIDLLF